MHSDQLLFGWVVHPDNDVSGSVVKIKLNTIDDATFRLKLYHTWRGMFLSESELNSKDGLIEFTLPILKIEGGQSKYLGQDVAFILEKN